MATVSPEAFIDLELSQIEHGVAAVDKVASSWAADFGAALVDGDLDTAAQLSMDLDLSGAAKKMKKPSLLLADATVAFGAAQAVDGDTSAITVEPLLDPLVLNTQVFMANALVTAQGKAMAVAQQMVAAAATEGRVTKAEADAMKPLKAAMNNLAINLSATSSRLASYGFLLQAQQNGEVIYKLSAVIDSRTSEFCLAIDGKILPVTVGFNRALTVLGATSPEEAAAVAPWPTLDEATIAELKKAGVEELIRMGFILPPFHPHCRTILQAVSVKGLEAQLQSSSQVGNVATASSVVNNSLFSPSSTASTLSLLGVGAAVAATLVGTDDTSLVLPGVDIDVVRAAVEDIQNGATNLDIMQEYGLTWLEVLRLRQL